MSIESLIELQLKRADDHPLEILGFHGSFEDNFFNRLVFYISDLESDEDDDHGADGDGDNDDCDGDNGDDDGDDDIGDGDDDHVDDGDDDNDE